MRILIGIKEIASFIAEFTSALRSAGKMADSVVVGANRFYGNNKYTYFYDPPRLSTGTVFDKIAWRLIEGPLLLVLFLKYLPRYQTFIYFGNVTFLPLKADLLLLRLLRKRAIVFNCGDDVRFRPIQNKIDKAIFGIERLDPLLRADYEKAYSSSISFLNRFFTQRLQDWFGCIVVTMRNQATFQKKPAYIFRFPTRRLLKCHKEPHASRPLIIHAPTDRSTKGTRYVLEAISQLSEKGLTFEFELIEGKDNSYVLSRLIDADILIDQPGTWIGRLGSEGLAASCVVIGGNASLYEGFSEPSPVIQFWPDVPDLASKLEQLVRDRERRASIMKDSLLYWENTYSYEAFGRYFDGILESNAPVLHPIPNIKKHLLTFADNSMQRTLIRLLF